MAGLAAVMTALTTVMAGLATVMAGLVPAISTRQAQRTGNRDARVKPAHDALTFVMAALAAVMAGLVPAISIGWLRLGNFIIQIPPCIIFLCNKPRLPSSRPMLDVLFALDCLIGGFIDFEMDQLVDSISLR